MRIKPVYVKLEMFQLVAWILRVCGMLKNHRVVQIIVVCFNYVKSTELFWLESILECMVVFHIFLQDLTSVQNLQKKHSLLEADVASRQVCWLHFSYHRLTFAEVVQRQLFHQSSKPSNKFVEISTWKCYVTRFLKYNVHLLTVKPVLINNSEANLIFFSRIDTGCSSTDNKVIVVIVDEALTFVWWFLRLYRLENLRCFMIVSRIALTA